MSQGVERSDAPGEAFALCPPGEGRQERLPKPSNDTGRGRRYKQGQARYQAMLLPPSVEDYVGADNLARPMRRPSSVLTVTASSGGHPLFSRRRMVAGVRLARMAQSATVRVSSPAVTSRSLAFGLRGAAAYG